MNKTFHTNFRESVEAWSEKMNSALPNCVPAWFVSYLIETRSGIEPKSSRKSIKIESWKGHDFDEIEAHLHAMHISMAGALFNSILSKKTGYMMMHQCGCDDCFYEGEVVMRFPDMKTLAHDFLLHTRQEARLRKSA